MSTTETVEFTVNTTRYPAVPVVKWAGGKTKLLPRIVPILRRWMTSCSHYHEPFLGGGAVFFALEGSGYLTQNAHYLADTNRDLVNVYSTIRREPEYLIAELSQKKYANDADAFARIRASDPPSRVERAARFVYLNRTCFNGLYRVNKAGKFNVPFGRYLNPTICDAEKIRRASIALARTIIDAKDYEASFQTMLGGDIVYCDPPYAPASSTANFVGYADGGFTEKDQERLAILFSTAKDRGVRILLSNSDTPLVRRLYQEHTIERVEMRRNINSKADRRGPVGEVLVY